MELWTIEERAFNPPGNGQQDTLHPDGIDEQRHCGAKQIDQRPVVSMRDGGFTALGEVMQGKEPTTRGGGPVDSRPERGAATGESLQASTAEKRPDLTVHQQ